MKYRNKPVVIDAVIWDGNADTANKFIGEKYGVDWRYEVGTSLRIVIPTLEGNHTGDIGDYIIKGIKNEFYPYKPNIFEATYEPVLEDMNANTVISNGIVMEDHPGLKE